MHSLINRHASRLLRIKNNNGNGIIAAASTTTPSTTIIPAITKRAISSAQLTIHHENQTTVTATSKSNNNKSTMAMPPKEELQFGKLFSPHMLQVHYTEGRWHAPEIVPFQELKLHPAASALHYGLECFEGMKAYKSINDSSDLRLFRPDLNMKRLKDSMDRLSMPGNDFDAKELIKCIGELVRVDQDWIPSGEGYSMYLRPTVIATHPFLGLAPPDDLLLYVITSPVGPYYKTGFDPVRLTTDTPYVRAWPGGSGASKVGGNYGPTMKPAAEAVAKGYSQVLWIFGEDEQVTEVGAMNVFFLLEKKGGGQELVTPPLTRGDILPGVTRNSILALARNNTFGEVEVSERSITMPEIKEAYDEGRLIEAFGAGTAAVVTPISCIQYRGEDIEIPATGNMTKKVFSDLMGIQYGRIEGPEGWSVKV